MIDISKWKEGGRSWTRTVLPTGGENADCRNYVVHYADVAWVLTNVGCGKELVAAGWRHGEIEESPLLLTRWENSIKLNR